MPNIPTIGTFIPGYLNTANSPSPSGQGDAYGLIYPSGAAPGKVIMLSAAEARGVAAPGTLLLDGSYQWVQLDSSANANLATQGYSAWVRLDSGPTTANQITFGRQPQTYYERPIVTTADVAGNLGLLNAPNNGGLVAGVFINPAMVNGIPNAPTPGNWTFIFVGTGRALVNYTALPPTSIGGLVIAETPDGKFTTVFGGGATSLSNAAGIQIDSGAVLPGGQIVGLGYWPQLIYRVGGQGV